MRIRTLGRIGVYFVIGMLLVILVESDVQRASQLLQLVWIDYLFLALWGALFGLLPWAAHTTIRQLYGKFTQQSLSADG